MNIHDFVFLGWEPPDDFDRVRGLIEVRDFVIIVTDGGIYRARDEWGEPIVEMLHVLRFIE